MYNILIGGAAGQGIDTTVAILEKLFKRSGFFIFTIRDFMSRIRGGHNFAIIAFGPEPILSHQRPLDGIIALNEETVELHKDALKSDGFIICDNAAMSGNASVLKIDFGAITQTLANPRAVGSIAIGAVLKIFGLDMTAAPDVLASSMKTQLVQDNLKAITAGYAATEKRYEHHIHNVNETILISGSNAVALGALAAGLRFYSAYPMSPSTSIMEYLASHSEEMNIVVEQAEDEIAAINMAIGASFTGARAMTGTSGGGFSLMVEALGLAGIAEIPLVIVNAQRPGPATGFPTRTEQGDLKFVISAAQGEFPRMVIALRNHHDAFYQTVRAFNLAEKYQMPVIILSDQYLGDTTTTVEPFNIDFPAESPPAEENAGDYRRYMFTANGISPRLLPGKTSHLVTADSDEHDEYGRITESAEIRVKMVDKRMKKLQALELELIEPDFLGPDRFDTLLIGWGSTFGPIADAVNQLNKDTPGKYAALIFGDVFPLPKKRLLEKAASARSIINIEQNATGQLAGLIREQTGVVCTSSVLKYDGRQISGDEIVIALRGVAE